MLVSGLSLFDTGLMITIITLLILYLIVLIKLKPSGEGKGILKANLSKKTIHSERPPTELSSNPQTYNEPQEESVETAEFTEETESVETPELAPPPIKTEISKETRNSGCPHHFGYLRDHPKNTPIPNECLTCTSIMECLLGVE
jgi:outer membrane biosynthesis protein TonB